MGETKQKYFSVTYTAQLFGLNRATVLDYCHARGQRFAYQPSGENGKWLIDIEKFEEFLARRTPGRTA